MAVAVPAGVVADVAVSASVPVSVAVQVWVGPARVPSAVADGEADGVPADNTVSPAMGVGRLRAISVSPIADSNVTSSPVSFITITILPRTTAVDSKTNRMPIDAWRTCFITHPWHDYRPSLSGLLQGSIRTPYRGLLCCP